MNVFSRLLYLAIFLACAGLIGFGLILQHQLHLEPCPMCIMQRYAFVLVGLLALIAALINPGKVLRLIFSLLIILSAGAGAAVAARQSWIQHFPPKIAECGADLEFMLQSFPLADALPKIFQGSGDCSKVQWTFMALSIAEWAFLWFLAIIVVAWLAWRRR
jgi:protein dithiol:quinone oxidoreductase